jgi:hypothetical protein
VNIVGVEQGLDMVMMFINAIDAVSTKTITANVIGLGEVAELEVKYNY